MWAHYANSHKGFCVGFDKFSLYESVNGMIGKVIYDGQFPETSLFDDDIISLIPLLHQKSEDWIYEDEYRVTKTGMARQKCILPNNAIREVLLGCKMEDEPKKEIINLVKNKFPTAKIFECKLNDVKFRLDLIPIF